MKTDREIRLFSEYLLAKTLINCRVNESFRKVVKRLPSVTNTISGTILFQQLGILSG
jgi:hypothetical protein